MFSYTALGDAVRKGQAWDAVLPKTSDGSETPPRICAVFFLLHFGDATELNAEYRHQLKRETRVTTTVVVLGHHVKP